MPLRVLGVAVAGAGALGAAALAAAPGAVVDHEAAEGRGAACGAESEWSERRG